MAAPIRSSGSKVVIAAVTATLTAVGIGTIYLPFIADRDKMRGMHEEKDPPTAALLAQEIQQFRQGAGPIAENNDGQQQQKGQARAPGSMWKNFRKE